MKKIVKKVVAALNETASRNLTSIADFKPSDEEVVHVSRAVIWTHAVMETMSEPTGTEMTYQNITGMTMPQLFNTFLCFRLMNSEQGNRIQIQLGMSTKGH